MTSTAERSVGPQDVVLKRKPGGQPGNKNRFKTGRYSKRNRALRCDIATVKRRVRVTLKLADALSHISSSPALCGRPNLSDRDKRRSDDS